MKKTFPASSLPSLPFKNGFDDPFQLLKGIEIDLDLSPFASLGNEHLGPQMPPEGILETV